LKIRLKKNSRKDAKGAKKKVCPLRSLRLCVTLLSTSQTSTLQQEAFMRHCLKGATRIAMFLAAVCFVGATTACQKLLDLKKIGPAAVAKSENELLGQKLELYIDCLNSFDRSAQRSYEGYAKAVGKAGPGKNSSNLRYSFSASNDYTIDQCTEKLKKGLEVQPQVEELDGSAQGYLSSMQKLSPVLKEANDYYKQEDYKDDNFAKGRELHGPLLAAFTEFEGASERMRVAVDKFDTQYKERSLAEIEQTEGRKLRYLSREMMVRAKQLLKAGDAPDVTAANLQPALDAYSQSIEAAQNYFADHKDETRNAACWTSVESSAKNFLKEAKDKLRYLREHNKPPPPQRSIIPGDRFIDTYNSLIMSSNICLNML